MREGPNLVPQSEGDMELVERATKTLKGMEQLFCEEKPRKLGLLSMEEAQEDLSTNIYPMEGGREVRIRLCSVVSSTRPHSLLWHTPDASHSGSG